VGFEPMKREHFFRKHRVIRVILVRVQEKNSINETINAVFVRIRGDFFTNSWFVLNNDCLLTPTGLLGQKDYFCYN
jgi:hypothetical protein